MKEHLPLNSLTAEKIKNEKDFDKISKISTNMYKLHICFYDPLD